MYNLIGIWDAGIYNLISIWDTKIHGDKTLSKNSLFLTEALRRTKNRGHFHEEMFEDVICPFELMLTLSEVANDFDNKRRNNEEI